MSSAEPSVKLAAFNCPYCSAFTTQQWFKISGEEKSIEERLPVVWSKELESRFKNNRDLPPEDRERFLEIIEKLATGIPSLTDDYTRGSTRMLRNLHLSQCYHCDKMSVWVGDRLVFPIKKTGVVPNPDLPEHIARDFEEARGIVDPSPRAAAALLRLCVQKLCKHLGEPGKNIDTDIGSLVKKGLNPVIQQSLDIVRVIGNESVHPGTIDLNDDRETALQLFEIVNAVADQMISHPKKVSALYAKLPETKRKGIENRDKGGTK